MSLSVENLKIGSAVNTHIYSPSYHLLLTHKKNRSNRGIYPPAEEYMIHAERSNESLVEAFKNMHVHEEVVPDDNDDTLHEVLLS